MHTFVCGFLEEKIEVHFYLCGCPCPNSAEDNISAVIPAPEDRDRLQSLLLCQQSIVRQAAADIISTCLVGEGS